MTSVAVHLVWDGFFGFCVCVCVFCESHCELKGLNKYVVTDAQIISSLSSSAWLLGLFDLVVLVPESLTVDQDTQVSRAL